MCPCASLLVCGSLTEQKSLEEEGSQCWEIHSFAQRSCGCPIPGDAQGQVGWGPGQSELLEARSSQQGLELEGL